MDGEIFDEEKFQHPRFKVEEVGGCYYRTVQMNPVGDNDNFEGTYEAVDSSTIQTNNVKCDGVHVLANSNTTVQGGNETGVAVENRNDEEDTKLNQRTQSDVTKWCYEMWEEPHRWEDPHVLRLKIPHVFTGHVIGKNKTKLTQLSRDHNVKIIIDDRNERHSDYKILIIKSKNTMLIRRAVKDIYQLLRDQWWKLRPTHFISLPLYDFESTYKLFKETVSKDYISLKQGLTLSQGLHFTVMVVSIYTKPMLDALIDVLSKLAPQLKRIFGQLDQIHLQGLHNLGDDAVNCRIIMTKDNTYALKYAVNKSADILCSALCAADLSSKESLTQHHVLDSTGESANVTLHATVMSAKRLKRQHFDATHFLKDFKDYDFGTEFLRAIELNEIGSANADGKYKCVYKIELKESSSTE